MKILFFIFLSFFVYSQYTQAKTDYTWAQTCQAMPQNALAQFCVHKANPSTNEDVIYYLHGANNNIQSWNENSYYPSMIRKYWEENSMDPPIVVSISFGATWLLTEKNNSAASGLLPYFTHDMLPEIEKKLGGLKGKRILLGESMGGFNSTLLLLKTKLFTHAALLCAPMYDGVSPYSGQDEIENYLSQTKVWDIYGDQGQDEIRQSINNIMILAKNFLPSESDAQKHDPITLAKNYKPNFQEEIYLAAGIYDQYALFEGNQKFYEILYQKGVAVDWHPMWGGHCAIDIPSLAEFLLR